MGIFNDLKKSFDTVDHEIIGQKFEFYGRQVCQVHFWDHNSIFELNLQAKMYTLCTDKLLTNMKTSNSI